jgi:hypothetical protein
MNDIPRREIEGIDPPAEWGSDADLDAAMLSECRKLADDPCPLAGSAWCEFECPFRERNWDGAAP